MGDSRSKVLSHAAIGILAAALSAPRAAAQDPLDLLDASPRKVHVQFETSSDRAVVGQSFGPEFSATYTVNGTVGTLEISAETHEAKFAGAFPAPVPGAFSPIVIEFDLNSFEATSQPANGAFASGPIGASFALNALTTTGTAGFMGPNVPSLYCASQADVDFACTLVPSFCGQTCTVVPGAPYDSATGLVNLVGVFSQFGCDGAICSGPFDFFASDGDLRLSEAPAPPPSSGGSNPCFIATAAYGTPMAGELDDLRAIRDHWLLGNPAGTAIADTYYRLSPRIAEVIARHEFLRHAVRRALEPVVWIARALR